jgi:hypothetical protein
MDARGRGSIALITVTIQYLSFVKQDMITELNRQIYRVPGQS